MQQIVNYPNIEKVDLSSVLNVSSGAAYLSFDLRSRMKKLLPESVRFVEGRHINRNSVAILFYVQSKLGYGMSETVRIVTALLF